jgi:hypothetical protein
LPHASAFTTAALRFSVGRSRVRFRHLAFVAPLMLPPVHQSVSRHAETPAAPDAVRVDLDSARATK